MSESEKCVPCPIKCRRGTVSETVLRSLDSALEKLSKSDSTSLLKRFFTREVLDKLKKGKTSYGATLLTCISSGIEHLDSEIGIYAADPESYDMFADLFDLIIAEYHQIEKNTIHPGTDWGTVTRFGNLDPEGKYIVFTRARICRNLKGFPFNARMTETHYVDIEVKMWMALRAFGGELQGTYHRLTGMPQKVQKFYLEDHLLFKENDRFLQAADACRFWPSGRGIYFNQEKTFLVWIGEEDHLRIMSMQAGGNVGQVFGRLQTAVGFLQHVVQFITHERLGYLTSCPSNLGNTIRACVELKLPKLASDMPRLQELASRYHIQVVQVEDTVRPGHSKKIKGNIELRNERRLGCTEFECLKEMCDGITEIILAEKSATK